MSSIRERIAEKRAKINDKTAGQQREHKFAQGKTHFIILPGKINPSEFFIELGMHWIKDPSGRVVTAVGDRETTFGEPCPVREAINKFIEYGQSIGDDVIVKRGKQMLARARYKSNILILQAEGGDYNKTEPVVADFSENLFDKILSQLQDDIDDSGDESAISKDGSLVFTLERRGTGLDTEYTVYSRGKKAPISNEVMDKAVDLNSYQRSKFDESVRKAVAYLSSEMGIPVSDLSDSLMTSTAPVETIEHKPSVGKGLNFEEFLTEEENETEDKPVSGKADSSGESSTLDEDDILAEIDNL